MKYLIASRCGIYGHHTLVIRLPHDARGPAPCIFCWRVP